MRRFAVFSADGQYRYSLTRFLDAGPGPTATFIMLNPSTADDRQEDPTIRKCLGFCRLWGCSVLHVVNLFAVRATTPTDMKHAADPVGPDNLHYLTTGIEHATRTIGGMSRGLVVCAWGVHGAYRDQDQTVLRWLDGQGVQAVALGHTKEGHPKHPLYVPYAAELIPFRGRSCRSRPSSFNRRPNNR